MAPSERLKSVRAELAIMVVHSLKSAMETDHVPKDEHIDPIKSSINCDDLHMRAHLRSKEQLIPALRNFRFL